MDLNTNPLGRRAFLGWVAKTAAGVAAFLGTSVGYAPRALALHNTNCLGAKTSISGPCSNPGLGPCVASGGFPSCVDVCNNNVQCHYNYTGQPARIKCTCHDRKCCLIAC